MEITEPKFNNLSRHEFTLLKNDLSAKGFLEPQPNYYFIRSFFVVSLLLFSIVLIVTIDNFYLQIFNAILLSFALTQISFITHEVIHRHAWKNDFIDLIFGNLLMGMSCSWWFDKHNKSHHFHTNEPGLDPDIEAPFIAFTKEQFDSLERLKKQVVRYQPYYFLPALLLVAVYMRLESIQFLIQNRVKYRLAEIIFIILHFLLYFGLLFTQLPARQAVIFVIINQSLFGLYMGLVMAINHIGMPVMDDSIKNDYIRKHVVTSRNLNPHPFNDFFYGGVTTQIEHHLFPEIPVNKMVQARKIVKAFCLSKGISYHEVGINQAYQEVIQNLHSISSR
ncbi:MAG: hypothetical protein F6K41_18000 [Symploca sp. SIO3E6]|nr:hypothetical protein [Caldora sp. SIO3E6]